MLMERDLCSSFFEYSHLVWSEIVHNGEGPLWNGEDIFMSLVANHVYGKHKKSSIDVTGGGAVSSPGSSSESTLFSADTTTEPFNNYAMDWLNVWQADDSLKDYDNGKFDISGGFESFPRFWDWKWWQTLLRRNRHYSYRGKLWQLARARLKELASGGSSTRRSTTTSTVISS
jgi:hypothetical protein